ncbi:MAG: ABC transporter ATP-binding protein [Bacillota bacterium]
MSSVEAQNLSVKYGDFYAVRDVSFSVEKGEIFGFLGANGAGKTTTIRVLCGLLLPTEGVVQVAGVDVLRDPFEVKKRVGYMSQKFTLYDDMTIAENLEFTASLRKMERGAFETQKERLLHFIKFRSDEHAMVRDLSGGIKQQVSLVSAILHDPEVIFLDEPTAGVSPAYRMRFWSLIRELAAVGKTVFVTTHYMDEAEQCGRIALMRDGGLIALDTPQQLKRNNFPHRSERDVTLEEVFIAQVEGVVR